MNGSIFFSYHMITMSSQSSFISVHVLLFCVLIGLINNIPPCQTDSSLYDTCSTSFTCGSINVTYPFWGGSRTQDCGYDQLELTCESEVAKINIANVKYRLLNYDPDTRVMQIARDDYASGLCSPHYTNTTLDPALFELLNGYIDFNLVYGCPADAFANSSGQFSCSVNGTSNTDGYLMEGANGPTTCFASVVVPMSYDLANSASSVQNLLQRGFEVRLKVDATSSKGCIQSKGVRGYDHSSNRTTRHLLAQTISCSRAVYSRCGTSADPPRSQAPTDGALRRSPTSADQPQQRYAHGTAPTITANPPLQQSTNGMAPTITADPPRRQSTNGMVPTITADPPRRQSTNGMAPITAEAPQEQPTNGSKLKKWLKISTVCAAVALIGITMIIQTVRFRKHRKLPVNEGNNNNVEVIINTHEFLAPRRYRYFELKKMTNSFTENIGRGGYGIVYKGKLPDGRLVAVKLLIESKAHGEEFINEVVSISRTSHINVVSLLGFCYERNKRALIYEFMPNGSLDKFIPLEGALHTSLKVDWKLLHRIGLGIARGLEYLHRGCKTRILHFDIKPQNILLDKDFIPKISDFGLAKLCLGNESIVSLLGTRGTIGYIAPEVISRNFGQVSHKSDVYSYGMLVLAMVCGKSINNDQVSHSSDLYFPRCIYKQLEPNRDFKFPGIVTKEEEEIARKLILVSFWCIQTNPSGRPSITKVIEMLEGSLHAVNMPPEPFLSDPASQHENLAMASHLNSYNQVIEEEESTLSGR